MRFLNVLAALSGLAALILLVASTHAMADAPQADIDHVRLAAFIQLGCAAAGLAIANRSGRLNLIAGALILAGAALFTLAVDAHAIGRTTSLLMLAPAGGIAMMLGWVFLAFASPTKRQE